MHTVLDRAVIERLCRTTTGPSDQDATVDVLLDPLDGSMWVRVATWPRADEAHRALTGFGLAVSATDRTRLHVTGWDPRLLRGRLGGLLAAVDDLGIEWDATAELAAYFYDQRANAVQDLDLAGVLADVEDACEQLICQHVDHAETFLAHRFAA